MPKKILHKGGQMNQGTSNINPNQVIKGAPQKQVNKPVPNPSQNINGNQLQNNTQSPGNSFIDELKNIDKSTIIIIVVIILLLIFGGVMYFHFTNKNKDEGDKSTPESSQLITQPSTDSSNQPSTDSTNQPSTIQSASDSPPSSGPSNEPFVNYIEGMVDGIFEPGRPDIFTNDINKLLPGLLDKF